MHNCVWGAKGGREGKKLGSTWIEDCPEAAQALLEMGMDVNQKDIDGNSPLSIACSSEALGSIPVLIAFGADLYSRNKQMETPLWVASRFGHIKTMKMLMENYGCKTGNQNKDGIDEKEAAVKYSQFEAYKYLLGKTRKLLGFERKEGDCLKILMNIS